MAPFNLFRSRSSNSSKGGQEKNGSKDNEEVVIDWEVRPCGLLVQKRGVRSPAEENSGDPMVRIKVCHGFDHHEVTLSAHSTFGDLKKILEQKIGLEPKEQRLLFRGKEKDDDECLYIAGLVDMSKVILLEDPASKERKLEDMKKNIAKAREEIDKLSEKVEALEAALQKKIQVYEKEFGDLTNLLMLQLLKLDGIEAEGEAKEQRRIEIHRVQSLVEKLEFLLHLQR